MLDKLVHEHTILGIDPGTTVMGYAVIHTSGSNVELMDMGVLDLRKLESHYEKLQQIFFRVTELLDEHSPSVLAIETQFVPIRTQKTTIRSK